jgi:predicted transcriptional regulator
VTAIWVYRFAVGGAAGDTGESTVDENATTGPDSLGALARELYVQRRARDELFDAALFAEPAWDILLDLFALEQEGRTATVAMVAAGASIPLATARRFVEHLIAEGFVVRSPAEARNWAFLQLTDEGRARMREALGDILKRRAD